MNNENNEELFADLFAYRFALQDVYQENESQIIIKLKLKLFEWGYNNRNTINNIIQSFYDYYQIPILPTTIENSSVMIYSYSNNDYIFSTNRLYSTILAVLDNIDENNEDNENREVLTEEEFENLEIIKIDDNHIQSELECSICIDKFEKDQEAIKLKCNHLFHKNCIKSHLLNFNNNCPLCRENI